MLFGWWIPRHFSRQIIIDNCVVPLLPKTSQTSKLGVALEEAGVSWDLAKLDAVEADVGCEHLLVEQDVAVSRVSWSVPQT